MEFHYILGYFLAVLVGISLGLIGSGGSILSVPILVYIMKIEPVIATAYSLFIVGSTALIGGIQKAREKLVDFKKVFLFGIPTVITVFITRLFLLPRIPKTIFLGDFFILKSNLIMIVFAIVMLFASIRMIKPIKNNVNTNTTKINYFRISLQGIFIGLIAGFVGAGGGFLIIPALLFLLKTPMKMAVGTSLFIVASQSLIGFVGDLNTSSTLINWKLLFIFTSLSVVGFFIGNVISKKISGEKLKTGFGYFVLAMAIYIISKEVFLN